MQSAAPDYNHVISELIKKQIVILGPDITLAKVRNVQGLSVDERGNVTSITGDPQSVLQDLINHFVELSGLIVKKTMESILPGSSQIMGTGSAPQVVSPQVSVPQPQEDTNSTNIPDTAQAVNQPTVQGDIASFPTQNELSDMSQLTPAPDNHDIPQSTVQPQVNELSELSPISNEVAMPSGANAIDEALNRLSAVDGAKQTQSGPSDNKGSVGESVEQISQQQQPHTPLIGGAIHDFQGNTDQSQQS